ncbi:unnamed protein product [marine sediment metagenome]|uniref:Uncharacterized protein n=1 Tax=marine sediment metagenome TaxID=412755 RepID=X0VSQ2_9ZZZZ
MRKDNNVGSDEQLNVDTIHAKAAKEISELKELLTAKTIECEKLKLELVSS